MLTILAPAVSSRAPLCFVSVLFIIRSPIIRGGGWTELLTKCSGNSIGFSTQASVSDDFERDWSALTNSEIRMFHICLLSQSHGVRRCSFQQENHRILTAGADIGQRFCLRLYGLPYCYWRHSESWVATCHNARDSAT